MTIYNHPVINVLFKEKYYEMPDNYPYKGTPNKTQHCGDFKLLKRAHKSAYNQIKYCQMCNKNKATVYTTLIPGLTSCHRKEYNACDYCVIDYFTNE